MRRANLQAHWAHDAGIMASYMQDLILYPLQMLKEWPAFPSWHWVKMLLAQQVTSPQFQPQNGATIGSAYCVPSTFCYT